MRPRQLQLWHLMSTVAVAALILAGLVWLFPPERPSASARVLIYMNFAGYEIPHTSPIFWLITGMLLAAVLGIVAALITAFVWATRGLTRRDP